MHAQGVWPSVESGGRVLLRLGVIKYIVVQDIKLIMPTVLILLFTIFIMVTVIPYAFSSGRPRHYMPTFILQWSATAWLLSCNVIQFSVCWAGSAAGSNLDLYFQELCEYGSRDWLLCCNVIGYSLAMWFNTLLQRDWILFFNLIGYSLATCFVTLLQRDWILSC